MAVLPKFVSGRYEVERPGSQPFQIVEVAQRLVFLQGFDKSPCTVWKFFAGFDGHIGFKRGPGIKSSKAVTFVHDDEAVVTLVIEASAVDAYFECFGQCLCSGL